MVGTLALRDFWDFLSSSRQLVRDFASNSGKAGIRAAILITAGAFLEGVSVSLLVPILNLIFNARAISGGLGRSTAALFAAFDANTLFARLLLLLAVFGVLVVLRAAVISARNIAIYRLQVEFVEHQRLRVTEDLAAARWEYIAQLRHARITHMMSGDIQRLGIGIQFMLGGMTASAMLLAQCVLAFFLSPVLALAILALLAAGTVALGPALAKARLLGGNVADANLALLDNTSQFLAGLKLATSQNLQASFVEETAQTLRQLSERQISYTRQQTRNQAGLTSLTAIVGAILVLAGIAWFHIAPTILITLLLLVTRMVGPAGQVQNGAQQLSNVLAIYERILDLRRELTAAARDRATRSPQPVPEGPIVLEHVSFRHSPHRGEDSAPQAARGLTDYCLTIAPQEFLAITGMSGVGKTTLADLLVGLYPPQAGRILVGGTTLDGPLLEGWRKALSYVSQDPFLFHDTIRRNLRWVDARASDADIWSALEVVGADGIVRRTSRGLDTVVGERGALISGGERQRIALARALLRKPTFLVLDEATSAIDAKGEREIFVRLRALEPCPTIVLIAHRTENLDICDRVVRLEPRSSNGEHQEIYFPASD